MHLSETFFDLKWTLKFLKSCKLTNYAPLYMLLDAKKVCVSSLPLYLYHKAANTDHFVQYILYLDNITLWHFFNVTINLIDLSSVKFIIRHLMIILLINDSVKVI